MVRSLRAQCIELLTEIEARLDFDDEMPPLDINLVTDKIGTMLQEVDSALETANYDKLLQSGVQVFSGNNTLDIFNFHMTVALYCMPRPPVFASCFCMFAEFLLLTTDLCSDCYCWPT